MKHGDLPERWAKKLEAYLREERGSERGYLSAADFGVNQHLKINFPDGSFAFFQHAFYLLDREGGEVAVFTEHCGYHIFPLYGTQLAALESKWTDVGTD
jgi:hypothetical protein